MKVSIEVEEIAVEPHLELSLSDLMKFDQFYEMVVIIAFF